MLEIGLLNIDDRQYNIDNDDDSRVDENGKRSEREREMAGTRNFKRFLFFDSQNLQSK